MSRPITDAAFLIVDAGVRYWEDATVNKAEDTDGALIPLRVRNRWRPTIRIADGVILDWPSGTVARIHYKVCDDGSYQLLDAQRRVMASLDGYVPGCLSPQDNGYGDYIILDIDGAGRIAGWEPPTDYANDGAWEETAPPSRLEVATAETWDEETYSIEVVGYSGTPVSRRSWEDGEFELSFDMQGADLSRWNAGAAVLRDHMAYTDSQVGKIMEGTARIENGRLRARVQFSRDPALAAFVEDVRSGIRKNLSMGTRLTELFAAGAEDGRCVVYDGEVPIGEGPCVTCKGTGQVPDEGATLRAELDAARAEVARLTEEVARKDAAFDAHVAVTNQISANAIRVADENARLTAEVERLTGREVAAKPFVMACKEPGELDTFCGFCWRYWSEDASGCADGCPRAAWLAGCKS